MNSFTLTKYPEYARALVFDHHGFEQARSLNSNIPIKSFFKKATIIRKRINQDKKLGSDQRILCDIIFDHDLDHLSRGHSESLIQYIRDIPSSLVIKRITCFEYTNRN